MRYEERLVLKKLVVDTLQKALSWGDGDNPCDRFDEDDTHTETVSFEDGYEMDIKVCGVQYEGEGGSNAAWSEAVLFKDGCEVACTDPGDDLLGEWELEHDGNTFVVNVVCENEEQKADDDAEYDAKMQRLLWDILKDHWGHKVEIALYGDKDDPANISLEDMDTNEVILDAGIYTICAREDA